ncbi:MAG: hypothetical protein HYS98_08750 [Deltaproteobacteria bacterium]|nr:hypothetical protein [Deltaproteobacteria bacterium]
MYGVFFVFLLQIIALQRLDSRGIPIPDSAGSNSYTGYDGDIYGRGFSTRDAAKKACDGSPELERQKTKCKQKAANSCPPCAIGDVTTSCRPTYFESEPKGWGYLIGCTFKCNCQPNIEPKKYRDYLEELEREKEEEKGSSKPKNKSMIEDENRSTKSTKDSTTKWSRH